MTILTKPSNEKNKTPLPLGIVADEALLNYANRPLALNNDGDAESMVFNRQHFSLTKTILLFLASLLVMLLGVIGGYSLYRMYASHGTLHFRGMCDIPYNSRSNSTTLSRLYGHPDLVQLNELRNLFPQLNNTIFDDDAFFREEIELDMADESNYAKIDVPNFKDGRRARFMHDFKDSESAIIDMTANRCFIMPLDKETTLPPRSFLDLMMKMQAGYYNIDTNRVRKHMRVVTPELTDLSLISQNIAQECKNMRVYLLENSVPGVFKRDVTSNHRNGEKYIEFAGKKVVEVSIVNLGDIEKYAPKSSDSST